MNCGETTNLFSDYYDGGLLPAERQALEEHLKGCTSCTGEFKVYSDGLQALQKTRPIETTDVFLASVRDAARAHVTRKETLLKPASPEPAPRPAPLQSEFATTEALTVRTPTLAPPSARIPIPPWVPWSLAAAMLFSFTFGWLVFNRAGEVEDLRRRNGALERDLEAAKRKLSMPRIPVEAPVDKEKILAESGLEKDEAGRWVPKDILQAFREEKVIVGGKPLTKDEAYRELAKLLPAPPQKTPETATPPPAPDPEKIVAEAMAAAHYRKYNNIWFPEEWVSRFENEVLIGVDQWKKKSDFKDEFIRENGLVEDPQTRRLITREQLDEQLAQQLVKKPAAAPAENEVTKALDRLRIASPRNLRGLTVYPLLSAEGAPVAPVTYMTLHTAQGPGTVELLDIAVFSAQVKNPLDAEIFVVCGELLQGGRCARVVAEDTLVPRKEGGRVPIFCVEPAAWHNGDKFAKESGHYLAPPSIRRALVAEQGQGAVWALMTKRTGKAGAGLPDLFRKRQDELSAYREYFTLLADREPASIGIAIAVGETLDSVELFQDHGLFAGFLDRLVAASALDIVDRAPEAVSRGPGLYPNSVKGVKQFLENAFFWSFEPRDEGFAIRKEDGLIGHARVAGGTVNHLLLFTPGLSEWDRRAVTAVPREKMAKVVAESEARLKTLGPAKKTAAIHDVASIASPEVTAFLVRHLSETDPVVRRVVVQELGQTGDAHAAEALLALLPKSRQEAPLFAEIARALSRLGDERAVDPFLRQLDQSDADLARVLIAGLPELLLQARTRDLLERATGRLVTLYEACEGMTKGDVILDPVVKGVKASDAQSMLDLVRAALRQLVGREFTSAPACRAWWNDRETKEKFLRERTGK